MSRSGYVCKPLQLRDAQVQFAGLMPGLAAGLARERRLGPELARRFPTAGGASCAGSERCARGLGEIGALDTFLMASDRLLSKSLDQSLKGFAAFQER